MFCIIGHHSVEYDVPSDAPWAYSGSALQKKNGAFRKLGKVQVSHKSYVFVPQCLDDPFRLASSIFSGINVEKTYHLSALEMISLRFLLLISVFLICYVVRNPFSNKPPQILQSLGSPNGWTARTTRTRIWSNKTLNNAQKSGPRVRQATMIYETGDFNETYERAAESHIRHGERWGTPTHILRRDIVDAGFFNKPAFLLGLIINEMAKPYDERTDWIVWFDADTIMLNPGVPWTLFLPPPEFDDIHFLGSRDQNGFNAGMFMIRVHEWSVTMLSEVVALRTLHPDINLDFYDQSAIAWVNHRTGYQEHCLFQPHNWWNAFGLQGDPVPTDFFTLHFAGVDCCGGDAKGTIMSRWLDRLDNNPDEWHKPLGNMTLPGEVSKYWSTLSEARNVIKEGAAWDYEMHHKRRDIQLASLQLQQLIMDEGDDLAKIAQGIESIQNIMKSPHKTD